MSRSAIHQKAVASLLQVLAGCHEGGIQPADQPEAISAVRRLLGQMTKAELLDAIELLCERFAFAIKGTTDHTILLAITEFGMHPHAAEKLNLPTLAASLSGLLLPTVNEDKCCQSCAFRQGTAANQCVSTTMDALDCLHGSGGGDFMCHENLDANSNPTSVCRGYAQAVKHSIKEPA